jgi:hypothetical protein
MQEAMLTCIDITKPKIKISVAKLATRKILLKWLCKMANSVIGKHGELLEYCHLITNPKTGATWIRQVTGTDIIFFILNDKVLRARAKKVTYGLITCLIRPEKTDEPN